MVRLVIVVEGLGPTDYVRSVFVFRAPDWETARMRAIELGRESENSYTNAEGEMVGWRLVRVETLDLLGDELIDGREVYSEPVPIEVEPVDPPLDPEDSRPAQSGV